MLWGIILHMEDTNLVVPDESEYRDPKTGRFIRRPPGAFEITKENASALGKKRQEVYRRKAAKYLLEEARAINPNIHYTSDAWGMMVANQFTKIIDSQYPSLKDVYKIGQILGALPKVGEVKIQNDQEVQKVDDLEKAERILSIIERAKQLAGSGEVIDVDAK